MSSDDLIEQTRSLLLEAQQTFTGLQGHEMLTEALVRLDSPLRVAIAGKVKAGKSTLLNALVGSRIAPTDTGECTTIITWYRGGYSPDVQLYPRDGNPPQSARFDRLDTAIEVDLAGRAPGAIERLVITWPSPSLTDVTLIDTPGVDTLSEEVGDRAYEFLNPQDAMTQADAVLYLMKHAHAADLKLLEAFHDDAVSQPDPVNAIAVLSRADEVGGGLTDSMASARKISKRYSGDARIRRLVQMVVPVAGLLAESARTLQEGEFRAFGELAATPRALLDLHLLSADRFVNAPIEVALTKIERRQLLERFGIFGIRQAVVLVRTKKASTSSELAEMLAQRSGLVELQTILTTLFLSRKNVLKSRSGLHAIAAVCEKNPTHPRSSDFYNAIEQIIIGAHQFKELSAIASIRSGHTQGRPKQLEELERILGTAGTAGWQRLGLSAETPPNQIMVAALDEIVKWQRVAASPTTKLAMKRDINTAILSLERLVDLVRNTATP